MTWRTDPLMTPRWQADALHHEDMSALLGLHKSFNSSRIESSPIILNAAAIKDCCPHAAELNENGLPLHTYGQIWPAVPAGLGEAFLTWQHHRPRHAHS